MEKLEKFEANFNKIAGLIVLVVLVLYTFKLIELRFLNLIIFGLVMLRNLAELIYLKGRGLGASRILMLVGSTILFITNLIELL